MASGRSDRLPDHVPTLRLMLHELDEMLRNVGRGPLRRPPAILRRRVLVRLHLIESGLWR